MNQLSKIVFVGVSSVLISCGGGSESSTDQVVDVTSSQESSEMVLSAQAELAEMVIDPHNDLTLNFPLEVSISPLLDAEQRYITICRYKSEVNEVLRTECMYRGPLGENGIETTLTITSPDIELVAEVWSFVNGYVPNQYFWKYDRSHDIQSFHVR